MNTGIFDERRYQGCEPRFGAAAPGIKAQPARTPKPRLTRALLTDVQHETITHGDNKPMFRPLIPLLVASSLTAIAQTTWRDLRFGMTEEEVRKVYDGTVRKLSEEEVSNVYTERFQEEAKSEDILEDVGQKLEGLPTRARLVFDKKSNTLRRIDLTANKPFEGRPDGSEVTGASLAAIEMLNRDLSEKYGRAVTEAGACNATRVVSALSFSCKKMWKSEGETITMQWFFFYKRLDSVFLVYKPLPKDI